MGFGLGRGDRLGSGLVLGRGFEVLVGNGVDGEVEDGLVDAGVRVALIVPVAHAAPSTATTARGTVRRSSQFGAEVFTRPMVKGHGNPGFTRQ
ncbi:MAG TPA: hypothetical protein VGR13_05900 [Actinomycetota bacterium]|nr:hypothetical protein [Actinomycetota bacterium]